MKIIKLLNNRLKKSFQGNNYVNQELLECLRELDFALPNVLRALMALHEVKASKIAAEAGVSCSTVTNTIPH